MFLNKFKKIDFKYYGTLVNLQLPYHFYKLLFLLEVLKNLPLLKRDCDNALPFCMKNFLVFFYDISSFFGFLYSLSSLVKLFYFDDVVDCYLLYQLLFDFIFVKTLCLLAFFRVSPQLKKKINNNHHTINLKHLLQTKMQLCWAQNAFFST